MQLLCDFWAASVVGFCQASVGLSKALGMHQTLTWASVRLLSGFCAVGRVSVELSVRLLYNLGLGFCAGFRKPVITWVSVQASVQPSARLLCFRGASVWVSVQPSVKASVRLL